jgi:DNA modification methylase
LKDLLEELDTGAFDMDLTGFDQKAIEDLMTQFHSEGLTDDDEVPEVKEPICKMGDLWQLGEHRLLCGDATRREDVERLMEGEKADMVFTDPPYGINLDTDYTYQTAQIQGVKGKTYPKVIGDSVKFNPKFLLSYFQKVDEIFLWGADYYHHSLPESGHFLVWDKSTDDADKMFGSSFEICWSKQPHKKEVARIFYRGAMGATKDDGHRKHPTQKPVRLALWFFERWGKKANIIVDIYGGSGTTLIAAHKLGRRCYMMEIEPHYCDVIIKRWENFTGKQAELANG